MISDRLVNLLMTGEHPHAEPFIYDDSVLSQSLELGVRVGDHVSAGWVEGGPRDVRWRRPRSRSAQIAVRTLGDWGPQIGDGRTESCHNGFRRWVEKISDHAHDARTALLT